MNHSECLVSHAGHTVLSWADSAALRVWMNFIPGGVLPALASRSFGHPALRSRWKVRLSLSASCAFSWDTVVWPSLLAGVVFGAWFWIWASTGRFASLNMAPPYLHATAWLEDLQARLRHMQVARLRVQSWQRDPDTSNRASKTWNHKSASVYSKTLMECQCYGSAMSISLWTIWKSCTKFCCQSCELVWWRARRAELTVSSEMSRH